ncbi:uncharacterized protein [Physcomitrium patens]|uniref:uncharacterized protein isoform X1 n=1 Tax=Physcomitrium patens TaxID=3218 RepID=UPI003CCDA13B
MANNAFTKYCGICGGHNKNYGGISNIPYQMISSAREGKRATLSASSLPWSEARRAMRRPISRHADWVRLNLEFQWVSCPVDSFQDFADLLGSATDALCVFLVRFRSES